jgi:ribosomal protein S18 acetylase RimI-like enzyme
MAETKLTVRPLDETTWPAFAALVEKHNGVWGGCWCLWFHQKGTGSKEGNRQAKHELVCAGKAQAALVFDGETAIGWCQFGRPEDLPRIQHKKGYQQAVTAEPAWRITCFFIDRDHCRRGVARTALDGALQLIAAAGGGLVESFPAEVGARKTSASFLYNATLTMFERAGFERVEKIGMHHWLVTRRVRAKAQRAARPVN